MTDRAEDFYEDPYCQVRICIQICSVCDHFHNFCKISSTVAPGSWHEFKDMQGVFQH